MNLRFSIRELLLLTVIVALAVAWRLDRAEIARERAGLVKMQKAIESDVREIENEVTKLRADHDTLQSLRLRATEPE